MKIKVKKSILESLDNYQLNENLHLNEDEAMSELTGIDIAQELNDTIEEQYYQQQRKESTLLNFSIPDSFNHPVKMFGVPIDIQNLMASFQVNKARKTLNLGDTMEDPVQTYNAAGDLCLDAFGKFSKIELETNKNKQAENRKNLVGSNESYIFNGQYNALNEIGPITAGGMVGSIGGSIAGAGLKFVMGAGAGFLSTFALPAAIYASGAVAMGYVGQSVLGNVTSGGLSNDEVAANIKNVKRNLPGTPKLLDKAADDPKKFDMVNVIDDYISEILTSISTLITSILPNAGDGIESINDYVNGAIQTSTKNIKDYINTNSKQMRDAREKLEQRRQDRRVKKAQNDSACKEFDANIRKLAARCNNIEDFIKLNTIQDYYSNNIGSKNITISNIIADLDEASDDFSALIRIYNEKIIKKGEHSSYQYNKNLSILNEAADLAALDIDKEQLDVNSFYNNYKKEIFTRINTIFKNVDVKSFAGIDNAKEEMQLLIDEANRSILSKIDTITKVSTGGSNGKGLSQSVKEFLIGHPLESDNLKEVWSRHLVDLKSRMNKRLRQMTDINNSTRTLGWIVAFCKQTVPDILARMLCYRYMYALLINCGMYTYTPKALEEDKRDFEQNKDSYIENAKSKVLWFLRKYTKEYTLNNEDWIIQNEKDGGYMLNTNNPLIYSIFLISQLNSGLDYDTKVQTAMALSNINVIEPDQQIDKIISIFLNLVENTSLEDCFGCASNDADNLKQLADAFAPKDDLLQNKELISKTYTNIINLINENIDDEKNINIIRSLEIILKSKTNIKAIYNAYLKNEANVDALIKLANSNSDTEKIKNGVTQYFKNNKNIKFDVVDQSVYPKAVNLFKLPNNAHADYYSYILAWYKIGPNKIIFANALNDIVADVFDGNNIKTICDVVSKLTKLAASGILGMCANVDETDESIKNILSSIKDAWNENTPNIEEMYRLSATPLNDKQPAANTDAFMKSLSLINKDKAQAQTTVKDFLEKGVFANLGGDDALKQFKTNLSDTAFTDKLRMKLTNSEVLTNLSDFGNSVLPNLKNVKFNDKDANAAGIKSINDILKQDNEITVDNSRSKDTIEQINNIKNIICSLLEYAVNAIESKGELTDELLKEKINSLGGIHNNAVRIISAIDAMDDTQKNIPQNITKPNKDDDDKVWDEYNRIERRKKTVDSFNTLKSGVFDALRNNFKGMELSNKDILSNDNIYNIFISFAQNTSVEQILNSLDENIFKDIDKNEFLYQFIQTFKSIYTNNNTTKSFIDFVVSLKD